jgi:hypothetical protein
MKNELAFPGVTYISMNGQKNPEGITMRDYFAAKALPPLIGNFLSKDLDLTDPNGWMDGLAMDAYSMADAMMKARGE